MGTHTAKMMKLVVLFACAMAVCSLPVEKKPNDFKAFLPFVSQIVTYTGAIIPTAMSSKHKHSDEFNMLLQTTQSSTDNAAELGVNRMPDPEYTVKVMEEMGKKASTFTGYNPVEMMSDLLGKEGMTEVVLNVTMFETKFPDTVTQGQVEKAEMMLITMGVFGPDSEANKNATENFMGSLSDTQLELIHSLNQNVLDRISDVMVDPKTGQPTELMVNETDKMIRQMEENPYMKLMNILVDGLETNAHQHGERDPLDIFNFMQVGAQKKEVEAQKKE